MKYKALIVPFVAVGLSGCLNDDDDSNASPDSRDGTWIQSCHLDKYNDPVDSRIIINGAESIYEITDYEDMACLQPLRTTRLEVISIVGKELTLSNGTLATETDNTITGLFLTPKAGIQATLLNTSQHCGIVTWAAGKTENIENCYEDLFNGRVFYDIYKVQNNRLYEGDDASGSGDTPEERPTSLDIEFFYQRQ